MLLLANVLIVMACICLATPVWYIPVRRCSERLGYPRTNSGRVQRATLVEWLNATGYGIFSGTLLMVLALWLRGNAE